MNPSALVIYVVRHPLNRIESHWRQIRAQRSGRIDRSFSQAVLEDPRLVRGSCYAQTLAGLSNALPRSSIHIETFDSVAENSEAVLNRCLAFLGLDHSAIEPIPALNRGEGKLQEPDFIRRLRGVGGLEDWVHRTRLRSSLASLRYKMLRRIEQPV